MSSPFSFILKGRFLFFLVPLLLLGCSRKQSEEQPHTNVQPSPSLPFQITVVETPETKEQHAIGDEAKGYLAAKDYDKLEALAAKYRSSKEQYADGGWKLQFVYNALTPPDDAPEADWKTYQGEIRNWIQAKPKSVTARIAMARFLKNYAWQARGSGYANTVSDQDWRFFYERLGQAKAVLNNANDLSEKCPFSWSTMMWIGLGSQTSKEQFNDIFERAIRAEPDFEALYQTRAIFLLPRWYGQAGEWEKDLAQSADKIGGDDGDMLYAQVVWGVHDYGSSQNVFDENPQISWDRVARGFVIIEKRFPDSLAAKNERAHLAALKGDKEKARAYFAETEGEVDLSDWDSKQAFTDAANWAFSPF